VDNHLFLVSTPLHLMVSIAIVDRLAIANAHLVFIDQVEGRPNPYLDLLQAWPSSPFRSVVAFYRPERSWLKKLQSRRETFRRLAALVQALQPHHIYTGNDRRVEFQLCMHKAEAAGLTPSGYYMDEGTFTYVGRKASHSWSDRFVDSPFKKLFYGSWWKHPATVGASGWISTVFASFPESIHPLLQQKKIIHLSLEFWRSQQLRNFCEQLVERIGRPPRLGEFDLIVTLPHESIIQSDAGYGRMIRQQVVDRVGQGCVVAVKYHPRDSHPDLLQLGELAGVERINPLLPFEALLPMLKTGATVLGDFSTTLITSRLLRPDLVVEALDHGGGQGKEEFRPLYAKLGIRIIGTIMGTTTDAGR
jgi:hypothetical protein